jgi:DNA-binding transcriptional MerR regulator
VDDSWTINELVEEVERRIAALPKPDNGQVRAVPDDRTIRYYAAIGLLDRPSAMRGRTALYGKKHVAQVVAIKRLQTMGRSLAEIQALWPTLDDATLSRMSGIELAGASKAKASRKDFWKAAPAPIVASPPRPTPSPRGHAESAELRVELAPNVSLSIALSDDIAISMADVAAIRAAAAPLIAELARRQLAVHADEGDDV